MKFVQDHVRNTLEIKQSKFIAHLIPYNLYDKTLQELKEEHPKARHFVVAWRYINEFDQVVEHCSDDGEPKGTSGKPTLAVLAGHELINTAVIIVRYFGGTKLGTGGLVRAYSDACNAVIQQSELLSYVKLNGYVFSVAYSDVSLVEYRLGLLNIDVVTKEFDEEGAVFSINTQKRTWDSFFNESERIIKMKQ